MSFRLGATKSHRRFIRTGWRHAVKIVRPCSGPAQVAALVDLKSDELSLSQILSSLRATGSRERAPDGKLREAIQSREQDWIASSRSLSSGRPKAGPVGSSQ